MIWRPAAALAAMRSAAEVRFYTIQHHTELEPETVAVITDQRESAERHERAAAQQP
jgi:hypothetical protein